MPPMDYKDAVEVCRSFGSEVGWISISDAKNYVKNILGDGHKVSLPYIFWTGVVRKDAFYFLNDTNIIKLLDKFPETEFWSTTVSDKGFNIFLILKTYFENFRNV